jgi:hypothetical protein
MIRRAFRLVCFASALGAGGLLALATTARERVVGSGVSATESRAIGNATEVVLSDVGDLTIEQGPPGLRVTADDNLLPCIESKTEGRKLTIRTRSRTTVSAKTPISYVLSVPSLDAVTISGVGNVAAKGLKADRLAVKLSGAGKVRLDGLSCQSLVLTVSGAGGAKLSGSAEAVKLSLSGAGDIDAGGLKAKAAEVRVSGAGSAVVWAENELKARVSGAGGIKYKGNPAQLEQKVSGAGHIKPVE